MSLACRPQSASPLTILCSALLLNRNDFAIALGGTESRKFCLIKVCGGSLRPVYEKLESYFFELLLLPLPWTFWSETVCNGGLRVWDMVYSGVSQRMFISHCVPSGKLPNFQAVPADFCKKKVCISSISEDNKELVMNVFTIFEGGYVEGRSRR